MTPLTPVGFEESPTTSHKESRMTSPTPVTPPPSMTPLTPVGFEESPATSHKESRMTSPTPVTPQDPYYNKAITAFVGFAIAFVVQWLASKGITLDQEGVTAIVGVVTTLLVAAVSNRKKLLGRSSWS